MMTLRTMTLLVAVLALGFAANQVAAAPGCCPSGQPSIKQSAPTAYSHNTQPLGGAAEEAKKAAKTCCPHSKTADARKGEACCPSGEKNKEACCGSHECGENCKMVPGGGADKKADKDKADKKDYKKDDKNKADKKNVERPGKDRAYKVGDAVKSFEATDAKSGKPVLIDSLKGEKATVLIFWNQACPFVVEMQDRAGEFARAQKENGVNVIALDAGVNNAVEAIEKYAADKPFPVLINRDTKIAAQFGATHTPEVFLLDKDGAIRYHGAFDSGRLRGENDTRKPYVEEALKSIVKGEKPEVDSVRAFGCTLKYAEGVKPLTR